MKAVRVAVCTYRRPSQLDRTLNAIFKQTVPSGWRLEFLVVDNDSAQSARTVVDTFQRRNQFPITYINEPQMGLGRARNRALDVSGEHSALVFFDDDQVPEPGWLCAFIARHEERPRTILCGPVSPRLPDRLPEWAPDGWPWRRTSHVDGEALKLCGDGNLLVPAELIISGQFRYSTHFLAGMGQDAELTLRMTHLGVPIRYVAGAAALEDLPSSRLNREWVINRCRMSACGWAKAELTQSRWRLAAIAMSAARQAIRSTRLSPLARDSEQAALLREAARARLAGYRDAVWKL